MAQDDFWKWAKREIQTLQRSKGMSSSEAAKYLKRNLDGASASVGRKKDTPSEAGRPAPQGRSPMQGKGTGSGKKSPAVGIRDSIQGKAPSKLSPIRKTGTTKYGAAKYEPQSPRQANTMGTPSRRPQSQKANFKPKTNPGPSRPPSFGNAAYTRAQQAKSNANYSAKSVNAKKDGSYAKGGIGSYDKSALKEAGQTAAAKRRAEEQRKAAALKNKQTMIIKGRSGGSAIRRGAM